MIVSLVLPDPAATRADDDARAPLALPRATVPGEGIGPSDDVGFRLFDPATNRPVAQVTVRSYRRTGEREVTLGDVTAAVAADGGGLLVLRSPRGVVRVEPPTPGAAESAVDVGSLTAADRATLADVTLAWYADAADEAAGRSPELTATVPAVVFDVNRMTLVTADTTTDGRTVLADDVPVTVRGKRYDFDGRGLLIEWDAVAARPRLVRVPGGGRLVVKQIPPLSDAVPPVAAGLRPAVGAPGTRLRAVAPQLPATNRRPPSRLAAATDSLPPGVKPAPPPTPYEARVARDVRATQSGQTLVTADAAAAVFDLSGGNRDLQAGPVDRPAEPRQPSTPTTRPTPPAPPVYAPVTLTWAGEFTLAPLDGEPDLADADDARLTLTGAPVVAALDGNRLTAAEIVHRRAAAVTELSALPGGDVTLADADGNVLEAPRLVLDANADEAVALGAGRATFAAADDAEPSRLRWNDRCVFAFARADGRATLRRVTATGRASVRADRLDLAADSLDVTFAGPTDARRATDDRLALTSKEPPDPGSRGPRSARRTPATSRRAEQAPRLPTGTPSGNNRPALERVVATGDVRCAVAGDDGEGPAAFAADRLLLTFPDGPDGPATAQAEGGVRVRRADGTLAGDRLTARVAADGTLADLSVAGNVTATDAGGRAVRGGTASLDGPDAPLVVGGGASVEADGATVAGETVVLDAGAESLAVPGAGSLAAEAGRVEWDGGFVATGRRADATGGVRVAARLEEADVTATAGELTVLLREEEPGTDPRLPARLRVEEDDTADGGDPSDDEALDAGRVESVELRDDVRVTAEERAGDGRLLRSADLRAPRVVGRPSTEAFEVPAAGRLLFRDLRAEDEENGFRGNAAFAWAGSLAYDPATGRLTTTGRSTAVVEPADGGAFRLDADGFAVETAQVGDRREVRSAVAAGDVRFEADDATFEAAVVRFDPAVGTLTARGRGEGGSVRVFDADGTPRGRFGEVVYDVREGRIVRLTELRAGG